MNALTLTLIRVAFLAVLWLFVIAAIGVVRTDLLGNVATKMRRGQNQALPLPQQQQALQDIRSTQEGRVHRRRPADHDMVAAARSGMAAVDHELVTAKTALTRFVIERLRVVHAFAP